MDAPAEALARFGDGRLTHLPGLDGVRGLAVAAVLLFHGNFAWMSGGYLGVSLFFTLSGFLITSLLLSEHRGSGTIRLRDFWGRRFRRLLPAAWLTIGVVIVVVWALGDSADVEKLRGDVWSSTAQVANWRFLLAGTSYADLFRGPSPLLHFWSLAIEEQFYVVFPLLVAWALGLARRRHGRPERFLTILLSVIAAVSFLLPVVAGLTVDRTYYGTDTRMGELVMGALLALVFARRRVRLALAQQFWPRTVVAVLGALALVACVVAWVSFERADPLLRVGALPAHSLAATVLIAAAALPSGPIRWLCGLGALQWLGRVSYAVYLFHWPLLTFLTKDRTNLGPVPRFVFVIALSLGLAELSRRYVEQPIRERQGVLGVGVFQPRAVAPVVVLALVAAPLVISAEGRARPGFDAESAQGDLIRLQRENAASVRTTQPTTAKTAPIPKVAPFGDSVALSLGLILGLWEREEHQIRSVLGIAELGCGIARYGQRKVVDVEDTKPQCDNWPQTWGAQLDASRPDLALVFSQWELVDRKMRGDDAWRHVGDPVLDQYYTREFLAATDLLASQGALVVWVTIPYFGSALDDQLSPGQLRGHEPQRVDALNTIIRAVVDQRPATARLIDLATWMNPRLEDRTLRKDGEHFNFTAEDYVARDFLGPALVSTWKEWWTAHH
ncbi:MAG: acyltransferase [Microthrixaceae bacterium]|nr:acyltransferase [Microthrixaceae bacterium]